MAFEECPVCSTAMTRHLVDWMRICSSCGFRSSTLSVDESGIRAGVDALDETVRHEGLDSLRRENFETVLDVLAPLVPRGARLLEVGSAHGWFLRAALSRGYESYGIEPDRGVLKRVAPEIAARTTPGFFPQDLPAQDRFDVIVFNDVFEHLPDVDSALVACRQRLRDGAVLVLNLPYSSGVFYRTAELMARLGLGGPLDRMWQRHFPSPHLSYFNPVTLSRLCAKHPFREAQQRAVRTVRVQGVWSRLTYDRTMKLSAAAATWLGTAAAAPVLSALPADVGVQFFRLDQ